MSGVSSSAVVRPRISVVTPVFNAREFVRGCMESVLSQSFGDFEYVVSDNHSTDGSRQIVEELAKRDPRVRLVSPERFLPVIEHRNFVLASCSATSEYVKWVDADDELLPGCIELMMGVAQRNPSVRMVGAMRMIDGEIDLDGIPPGLEAVDGRWLARNQLRGAPYTTGPSTATLIRRTSHEGDDPGWFYDTSYMHADDALAYRILCDWDFGHVPQPLTRTRPREESVTSWASRIGTATPERLRMVLEFGPKVMTPREVDRTAERLERRYVVELAAKLARLGLLRSREIRAYHRKSLALIDELNRTLQRRMHPTLRRFATLLGDWSVARR